LDVKRPARPDAIGTDVGTGNVTRPASGLAERLLDSTLAWFALYGVEITVLALLGLPATMGFVGQAFGDYGANLTAQALMDRGLRPAVDFGCIYGLLPLGFGRLWFADVGRGTLGYVAFLFVGDLALAWLLGRYVVANRAGWAARALIAAMLPQSFSAFHAGFTHFLEPLLLILALFAVSRGQRAAALAAATACLFVKPSMAYVVGSLLLLMMARDVVASPRAGLRTLAPAAAVGLGLAVLLGGYFGVDALLLSLSPASGARIYRLHNYGFFFGEGRNFLAHPNVRLGYYLGTIAATWTLATLLLAGSAAAALVRLWRGAAPDRRAQDEALVIWAAMHLAFVCAWRAVRICAINAMHEAPVDAMVESTARSLFALPPSFMSKPVRKALPNQ
jgi:hypothetical protein